MSESRQPVPLRGSKWITRIADFLHLAWKLFLDERVLVLVKLLPAIGVAYALFPFDIPLPLDDIAVMWLSLYLFIEMCPPEIVAEYRESIEQVIPAAWHDTQAADEGRDD